MNGARKCNLDSCSDPAVTCFASQKLCLHHFLARCYQDLNRFDVRTSSAQADPFGSAALKAFVKECSRCALEISLQCEDLDNLQRGRLLDILLWAGELLPETSADVSPGDSLLARGAKRGAFINMSEASVGCAIVESGTAALKKAVG